MFDDIETENTQLMASIFLLEKFMPSANIEKEIESNIMGVSGEYQRCKVVH